MKLTFDVRLTLQNYFELVDFSNLVIKEQVKRVLYYVTVYSGLRKEMGAKIIAARIVSVLKELSSERDSFKTRQSINDEIRRRIPIISEILLNERVFERVSRDPSEPDYDENEAVYVLSKDAIEELETEISKAVTGGIRQKVRLALFYLVLSCLVVGIFWIFYFEMTSPSRDQLSWSEISEATKFGEKETSYEEKAAVIVFYITKYIKFNTQMTPEAIAGRIEHLKMPPIGVEELTQRMLASPAVFIAHNNGFVLSQDKIESIRSEVDEYHGCVSRVHNFFKRGIVNSPGLFLTIGTTLALLIFAAGFFINYNYVIIVRGKEIMLTKQTKPK